MLLSIIAAVIMTPHDFQLVPYSEPAPTHCVSEGAFKLPMANQSFGPNDLIAFTAEERTTLVTEGYIAGDFKSPTLTITNSNGKTIRPTKLAVPGPVGVCSRCFAKGNVSYVGMVNDFIAKHRDLADPNYVVVGSKTLSSLGYVSFAPGIYTMFAVSILTPSYDFKVGPSVQAASNCVTFQVR